MDRDGGKADGDSELAVFVTADTLRKALSFAIIDMGKQLTNEQIAEIIGKHFPQIDDKLLNIFQLEQMIESGDYASLELLSKAIDTKIDTIKPFQFNKAIPFKKTAKYIKWALIPILLFIVIFAVKSEVFTLQHLLRKTRTLFI